MQPIIKVENLGKKYSIGSKESYYALRDKIANPLSWFKKNHTKDFWALKDINFEVMPGEALGIIGRNGAGKSTLLKILSRITPPTTGKIMLHGRVASLLEVGTGFHPELTGRENIFLNGAVLGMTRKEIKTKFDEIVAFAEIEKFLDTPVKRYSSGMYVRLAFAVAAHLEPEILVVDEVLAVGDIAFQKKCLGKMDEVAKGGRTVIFVSHNMGAIENLCRKTILLENGKMVKFNKTNQVIQSYLQGLIRSKLFQLKPSVQDSGTGILKVIDFYITNSKGNQINIIESGSDINFNFVFKLKKKVISPTNMALAINTNFGLRLATLWSKFVMDNIKIEGYRGVMTCSIPKLPLGEGFYTLGLYVASENGMIYYVDNLVDITVKQGTFYGQGLEPSRSHGGFLFDFQWNIK